MKSINLSICIVSMNHKKVLFNCLNSIYINSPKKYTFEVIVVDNCSTDGTIDVINIFKIKYKNISIILNKYRNNFSKNNNIAIQQALGEIILILNPDTIIYNGTLDYMLDFLKTKNDVGAATCKLLYPDGSFQENARKFIKLKYIFASRLKTLGILSFKNIYNEYILSKEDDLLPKDVDYILGACMFLKRKILDVIGLFDERFLLYGEDTDLCYRIKSVGWRIMYVPNVAITHLYARTSARSLLNKEFILQIYTTMLFYAKHYFKIIN